jgi:glyoxylase-like metal-dependent hydrolase (beta-lactamase superfamily II)
MNKGAHQFKIGNFHCYVLFDGILKYIDPSHLLFPNAPRDSLNMALKSRHLSVESWREWISDYSCMLIDTGTYKVLIDTGLGSFNPFTGMLKDNLQKIGIAPGDIDIVLFTHGHPDHIGGAVDPNGRSVFVNATYMMSRQEWSFWMSDPESALKKAGLDKEHRASVVWFAEQCLPPLQDQMQTHDTGTEIVSGIEVLEAFGHTPGHQVVRVFSEGEELLVMGDAFIQPLHIEHPEWCPMVDVIPEAAIQTRSKLICMAVERQALVSCFHYPFPCLGHIIGSNDRFQFQQLYPSL